VLDRLRQAIVSGLVRPGHHLCEQELARAFSVTRAAVRDALSQLERESFVVRQRNRRAIVASLSRADLEELFALMSALEPLVCVFATRNSAEDDWAEMPALLDRLSCLARSFDVSSAAATDLQLQDVIYRASGHKRLLQLWLDLRRQFYALVLLRAYKGDPRVAEVVMSYRTMLLAIRNREEELVCELADHYLQLLFARSLHADIDAGWMAVEVAVEDSVLGRTDG
jgi:DNA-binding GntR family transcriptional regulator